MFGQLLVILALLIALLATFSEAFFGGWPYLYSPWLYGGYGWGGLGLWGR